MAGKTVDLTCPECARAFRSKLKRGQAVKSCPSCGWSPSAVATKAKEASSKAAEAAAEKERERKDKIRSMAKTHRFGSMASAFDRTPSQSYRRGRG